jgi:hypothetical protein
VAALVLLAAAARTRIVATGRAAAITDGAPLTTDDGSASV